MITVIADDITGAAEIAGVCLRYGLRVTFGIETVPGTECDVCVISTDSRSATEAEAYSIYLNLTKQVISSSYTLVFKKCDSVLRGYVLSELTAMMEVMQLKRVILQPANPLSGRCIREGIYYVGNEKIEDTAFSHDPEFPATVSEVQELLIQRSPAYNRITNIQTGTVNRITGEGIYIPDCTTVEELKTCSTISCNEKLLCGSAAFFEQVLLQKGIAVKLKDQPDTTISSDFLLISGSTHSASRNFANRMRDLECPVMAFPAAMLQEKIKTTVMDQWIDELVVIWSQQHKLTLTISENNISFPGSSAILKQRMSMVVKRLAERCDVKELLIEGGATAYSILNVLNSKTLIPVRELSPGVIRMQNCMIPSMYLTIKPGSYPWPENIISL